MSEKNGGPYTKAEQEKRRRQVYEMHFEKSQSALYIAEKLEVNRNTINEDIKYWYSELAAEFEQLDIKNLMLRQHYRLELQRTRLTKLLEKEQNISNILKIERMIFDLDCTISKLIVPIAKMQALSIPDDVIVDTIQHLMSGNNVGKVISYMETEIIRDIVSYKKCDVSYAQKILDRMKLLGLDLFREHGYLPENRSYDLLGFAESRNILSDEKLQSVYVKMEEQVNRQIAESAEWDLEFGEFEEKLVEKFGDKSGWPVEVWKKYHARIRSL